VPIIILWQLNFQKNIYGMHQSRLWLDVCRDPSRKNSAYKFQGVTHSRSGERSSREWKRLHWVQAANLMFFLFSLPVHFPGEFEDGYSLA